MIMLQKKGGARALPVPAACGILFLKSALVFGLFFVTN
jgi:hypothetical protein